MKSLPRLSAGCFCTGLRYRNLAIALIVLFSAILAKSQVDPKCSDRTAQGQITCTIDQPVVNRHETVYTNVVFEPGDVLVVGASGCVQTGGSGNTWKFYVNPSGPNAGSLYHGLIRIPTATPGSGLDRINDVKDQYWTVTGTGVAQSDLVLQPDENRESVS